MVSKNFYGREGKIKMQRQIYSRADGTSVVGMAAATKVFMRFTVLAVKPILENNIISYYHSFENFSIGYLTIFLNPPHPTLGSSISPG